MKQNYKTILMIIGAALLFSTPFLLFLFSFDSPEENFIEIKEFHNFEVVEEQFNDLGEYFNHYSLGLSPSSHEDDVVFPGITKTQIGSDYEFYGLLNSPSELSQIDSIRIVYKDSIYTSTEIEESDCIEMDCRRYRFHQKLNLEWNEGEDVGISLKIFCEITGAKAVLSNSRTYKAKVFIDTRYPWLMEHVFWFVYVT